MKHIFKKMMGAALVCAMILGAALPATTVYADQTKSYLSLGADLTDDELSTVLGQLQISRENLSDYDVVYITNAQEYEYLGNYVSASKIGSRALSSVLIKDASKGSGIHVTTSSCITYCTPGMYENALATAGVDDVEVYVAGPFNVSGTAALVGAIKAYSEMTGETVSESTIDAAVDEIVTTGDIEQSIDADSESVEGLIAYLKEQLANGNAKDLDTAINEGCDKFHITLTEEQIAQIKALLQKLSTLDLDLNVLMSQAKSVYNKLGEMGISFDLSDVSVEKASGILQQIIDFFLSILRLK